MLYLDEQSKVRMGLLDAAEYIEKHGWCRAQLKNKETGAVCILGAIKEATRNLSIAKGEAMMSLVIQYLHMKHAEEGVAYWGPIAHWNDDICKSKEEAVKALIAAATQ